MPSLGLCIMRQGHIPKGNLLHVDLHKWWLEVNVIIFYNKTECKQADSMFSSDSSFPGYFGINIWHYLVAQLAPFLNHFQEKKKTKTLHRTWIWEQTKILSVLLLIFFFLHAQRYSRLVPSWWAECSGGSHRYLSGGIGVSLGTVTASCSTTTAHCSGGKFL